MLLREEKRALLDLARSTIRARLDRTPPPSEDAPSSTLKEPRGAFVTLHKKGALRGCIGIVEAIKPLWRTVSEMALASAFSDPRFPPLLKEEYDGIEIEISVMSPVRKVDTVDEIEVGTHGIIIKRGFQQGLLLPQVATEEGWDRETFLEHTCYKAGLGGGCWKRQGTEISVFSAEVFSERTV
ncbi:MAG: AmmeMemoRadiSam system protein A [Spirochaetes bacterium]|nr:AmmeMemoRadiSam system protein A [Spirochaetota bacterium]